MRLVFLTDGGVSGGNKEDQPCYYAYIAVNDGELSASKSSVGLGTSNQAEYRGLILAASDLRLLLEKHPYCTEIEFRSDSKIMVNQMSGSYKTKDEKLKILREEALAIIRNSAKDIPVTFVHMKRNNNQITDLLCNLAKKDIIKTNSFQPLKDFKTQHNLDKYKALKGID